MKAIVFHEHGGPEVLRYQDVPAPSPAAGQVLVGVKAAALNRLDLFVREGWPSLKLKMPHIPGADASGVVLEVGAGVEQVSVGDRVAINPTISCGVCEFCRRGQDNLCVQHSILGEFEPGTYTEQIVVPAGNVVKLPDHVSHAEAAAFSLVGLTAWHMLVTRGKVQLGERVLIVGASGGVNTAAIQIAHLAGAHVTVVGSDAEKLALAETLGADELIDRSQVDWSREIYRLTKRRGVRSGGGQCGPFHLARQHPGLAQGRPPVGGGQHQRPAVRSGHSLHLYQANQHHRQHHGSPRRLCRRDGFVVSGPFAGRHRPGDATGRGAPGPQRVSRGRCSGKDCVERGLEEF